MSFHTLFPFFSSASRASRPPQSSPPTHAPMAAELAEVATADLLAEVQRRLECTDKPEKRIILVGASAEKKGGNVLLFGLRLSAC